MTLGMGWTVETLNTAVDAELDALPASLRARVTRIVERIEAVGLENVGEPHVKHLEGKLWEIRAKGADGIARALYITVTGRRVVILHAFVKKTQTTPATALDIARQRAKQVTP
jgi:phage-related protein